jgi:hypothetical protein
MINTCKSTIEIENYLTNNGINLQIYYQDEVKVLTNFSYPLKKRMNTPFHYLDIDKFKYLIYFLNQNSINTDVGYLFERMHSDSYYSLSNYFFDSYKFDHI